MLCLTIELPRPPRPPWTLDSLHTLLWFVSYRTLAPKFQHSLSAVTLGIYLCENRSTLLTREYATTFLMMVTPSTLVMLCVSNILRQENKKMHSLLWYIQYYLIMQIVPRVQSKEDQVRLVAPTQMALCLRPCLLPTLQGESCYAPSQPSMTRLHNEELVK